MFNINNKNLISLGLGLLTIFAFAIILMPQTTNAQANVIDNCTKINFNGWYGHDCNYNYNNSNTNYNNTNPVPSITSISPNSTQVNSNTNITVSGNNFVPGSVVKFNNSNRSTTFIDARTLKVQLNYSDLNNKGEYTVTVFNPAPGGGFSNAKTFTVNSYVAPNNSGNTSRNYTTTTTRETTNTTNNVTNTTDASNQSDNASQAKELAAGALFGYNAFLPSSIFQWIFFFILILLAVILWRKLYVTEDDKHTPLKHA